MAVLVVLVVGFWFALTTGVSWVSDQFQGPDDYSGPGTGSVEFGVNEGDTTAQIGRNLKADGATQSVQAFIDAAAGEPEAAGIQAGDYAADDNPDLPGSAVAGAQAWACSAQLPPMTTTRNTSGASTLATTTPTPATIHFTPTKHRTHRQ